MDQQKYRRTAWALIFLYPVAAFVVFAISPLHDFRRDWPYTLAGPIGALSWIWVAVETRSWWGIAAGYLLGALLCALIVWALEAIVRKVRPD
ncbi:hypothetical protein [Vitreimonas flagellata]|uniref:hypothetical protein n=1 Tax=Vitreimonas flagellata TaxID=2560861 RepID=UPI001074F669|nr:hypothetical protein [Vitreimonas flagellata]